MEDRTPIHWAHKGLSDDLAYSQREPGTTSDETNCRNQDPTDGRMKGGQRPGQVKFSPTQFDSGAPIVDMRTVSRDRIVTVYTNLPITSPAASIAAEWTANAQDGRDVVGMAVDVNDNVYTLDSTGLITKYNTEGRRLRGITVSASDVDVVVPRLEVDLNGGVYAATGRADNSGGRLFRFQDNPDNNTQLQIDWELETAGAVQDFDIADYSIFAVMKHNTGQYEYTISRWDGTQDGVLPTLSVTQECPGPIGGMVVDGNGAVKLAVQEQTDGLRGNVPEAPGVFTHRVPMDKLWTPADLTNADQRVYSWLDALDIDGEENTTLTDGADVDHWVDIRHKRIAGLKDDLERDLWSRDGDPYITTGPDAPTLTADMGNGMPGVTFNGSADSGMSSDGGAAGDDLLGQGLHTQRIGTIDNNSGSLVFNEKANANSPMGQCYSLLPSGVIPGTGFAGTNANTTPPWAFFIALRPKHAREAELVLGMSTHSDALIASHAPMNFSLLNNATIYSHDTADDLEDDGYGDLPGGLGLFCPHYRRDETGVGATAWTTAALTSGGAPVAPGGTTPAGTQAEATEYEDGHVQIIAVVHNQGTTNLSSFRVNGSTVDTFTFTGEHMGWVVDTPNADWWSFIASAGGFTTVGCRRLLAGQKIGDLFRDANDPFSSESSNGQTTPGSEGNVRDGGIRSYNGEVLEIICVLGDTDTDANDLDIPEMGGAAVPIGTPWAGTHWLAHRQPSFMDEVSLIEGYLAHKWGAAHELPSNDIQDTIDTSNASYNLVTAHPYAGVGNYPRKPSSDYSWVQGERYAWGAPASVVKLAPGTLEVAWAAQGGGYGMGIGVDTENSALSVGPIAASAATANRFVPDTGNMDEANTVARKLVDVGDYYRCERVSRAALHYPGFHYQTHPQNADTFTITVGGTTTYFEYAASTDTGGGGANGTSGNPYTIATTGDLIDVMDETADVINAVSIGVTAYMIGAVSIELFADTASNTDIEVTVGIGNMVALDGEGGDANDGVEKGWYLTDATYTDGPAAPLRKIEADDNDDWFVPAIHQGENYRVRKLSSDGPSGTIAGATAESSAVSGSNDITYDIDTSQRVTVVRLPLSHPRYLPLDPDNPPAEDPTGPLFLYLGATFSADEPEIEKVTLMQETRDLSKGESGRIVYTTIVSDGNLRAITRDDDVAPKDLVLGQLDADSPYTMGTIGFGTVFVIDGERIVYYDFVSNSGGLMTSRADGKLPEKPKLIATWRGRLALARLEEEPHNCYFSRVGDFYNWNEDPVQPDGLEATSFSNSRVGLNADIINAIIPYTDDLLVVGGDHTIQVLSGDPLAGGQMDLVTDVTGIAFGEAWTTGPEGTLFFFGSRGGVYQWVPGQRPVRISRDRIERRMQNLDLTAVRVRLAWNWQDEGLQVVVMPRKGQEMSEPLVSWFLDKWGAWHEDEWSNIAIQPHSMLVLDGDDPRDRVLALGGNDGYVRSWDRDARSDDGYRIDSRILLGPLAPEGTSYQTKFMRPSVMLASDQQGCNLELFTSNSPQDLNNPAAVAVLGPGRNRRLPLRVRGEAVWVRLRNAAVDERWSFEAMDIGVDLGPRKQG